MSSFSKSSKYQATNAVNGLLKAILPGANKISMDASNKRKFRQSGSTAQIIDRNLKKRVELNERNVHRIKKRERKSRKVANKLKRVNNERFEQTAKLQLLAKHRAEGTLSTKEQMYLDKLLARNVSNAQLWNLNDDDKDELEEVQTYILERANGPRKTSKRRRAKDFKENIEESTKSVIDRKYPGLTPGLAPVGLSDEESSDDED